MARVASNPAPALSPVARQVEELSAQYADLDRRTDELIDSVFAPAAGNGPHYRQIQVDTRARGYSHANALRALAVYLRGQKMWDAQ